MNIKWKGFQKIGFLFLFIYLIIYTNSTQFVLSFLLEPLWQKFIPWFAKTVGHNNAITIFTNGSGDTTYNYFQVLFFIILSAFLAISIGLIDRKRNNYKTLLSWLVVLLRYYLALQMINYGFAKIFHLQFSFPGPLKLDQKLGEFSPMGLLWNFMGYSKGYTLFTGLLELFGGLLLLSRKTTTLGALATFGVMLNVMMLNYCYDVPVKLLSTHMVLMSLFLIALDAKRLFKFFISQEKTEPQFIPQIIPEKFIKVKTILKWVFISGFLGFGLYQLQNMLKEFGPNAPKPLFYGKYTVESFETKRIDETNSNLNPIIDSEWTTFYQNWEGYAKVKTVDDIELNFNIEPDATQNILKLKSHNDSEFQELNYELLDSNRVKITGAYQLDSIFIQMKKENLNDLLLVKRKFNWVNEFPNNH